MKVNSSCAQKLHTKDNPMSKLLVLGLVFLRLSHHSVLCFSPTSSQSQLSKQAWVRKPTTTFTSTALYVKSIAKSNKKGSSSSDGNEKRMKRTAAFTDWAKSNDVQIGGLNVASASPSSGLGLVATQSLNKGDVLVQVPTDIALSAQTPTDDNSKLTALFSNDKKLYTESPWWVQLSLQLVALDLNLIPKNGDKKSADIFTVDSRPWLEALPRTFSTPFHWSESAVSELQYSFLRQSVASQQTVWKNEYDKIMSSQNAFSNNKDFTFEKFVWGCECARSRAFSGSYSGSAFNPAPYAFTLLLITIYVGLNLGTLEQAANGAAVVVCGSIFKDFVFPKIFSSRKYVICPYIDMANHVGVSESGDVAFEYFSDSYSLSVSSDNPIPENNELMITYGPRSNDQLLQYYGFVEKDNAHDVYVMPPLRNWDIAKLEDACGRTFSTGRLQKLERAGLLGLVSLSPDEESNNGSGAAANAAGGVVISRAGGIDPAVIQALRALVSTDAEWEASGEAVGNFAADMSGGEANERAAKMAAKAAIEMELLGKPTSIEEDEQLLKTAKVAKSIDMQEEEFLAIQFRLEKKKLLQEIIDSM